MIYTHKRLLTAVALSCVLLATSVDVVAQGVRTVTGTVVDDNGQPIPGASVIVPGTTTGTVTDFDGRYSINVPEGANSLSYSFIGYVPKTIDVSSTSLNVTLSEEVTELSDVVVVGYGVQRKSDLTGSVSSVSADDFNQGLISSPEQLINGKVSGVQIMSASGSPTAGSSIRIRGGASLNASNDPLIVLDGVPLESGGISGSDNFLSLINPADIENMTILKDASSTAIYGSRASNGVIIITTKKGNSDKVKVALNTTNSLQKVTKTADMLSVDQFRNVVNDEGNDAHMALLGKEATDWNDEIYRLAFGTDNNLSIAGRVNKNMPLRASVGYYNQNGIVLTDKAERMTASVNFNPSFLDNSLKLALNLKGSISRNTFANTGAVWNAAAFNPTIPIYRTYDDPEHQFGGYNEAINGEGNVETGAVLNPLGMLKQHDSTSKVKRLIGNVDVDYKMFFLPELKVHLTGGYDYATGQGEVRVPAEAAMHYGTGGRDYKYGPQKNYNRLFTAYFNYNKFFESAKSNVDVTVGYDYQFWKTTSPTYNELNASGVSQSTSAASDQRHTLLSYYGRVNYSFDSRYMLTATLRRDGTSRFSNDDNNRWGTFPSVALAWTLKNESFLADVEPLSNLKARVSFGVTGQQDGIGNYGYMPQYTISQEGAQYQLGNSFYHTYRPESYVSNLKWETTKAWNVGVDLGFIEERFRFSADYYTRKTEDLLATVAVPAGTNFNKTVLSNVGNVESKGWEFSLNLGVVESEDWSWDVTANATWQSSKVTNLSMIEGVRASDMPVGPSIDSYQFQVLSEGCAPYAFNVYHQLYDKDGRPVEGAYADTNNDGQIDGGDLYKYHSPAPDWIFGLSTSVRWKKLTYGLSLRSNVGNYVYNGMAMNTGALETLSYNAYQLNNLNSSYLDNRFSQRQYLSDLYVENASFLKCDNMSLNYNFGKLAKNFGLSATFMVQNVFTITDYTGVDPEVPNGMDNSFYPRPRVFSLSLGFDF